jgi:hypothetical protein
VGAGRKRAGEGGIDPRRVTAAATNRTGKKRKARAFGHAGRVEARRFCKADWPYSKRAELNKSFSFLFLVLFLLPDGRERGRRKRTKRTVSECR